MAVSIDGLANAIAEELEYFESGVMEDVKQSVRTAAKSCVKELRTKSPNLTGDYRNGWTSKIAFESPTDIRVNVYNRTDYQLTHLLEDGHAKVGGGSVDSMPHIGPAADKASNLLMEGVKFKVGKK